MLFLTCYLITKEEPTLTLISFKEKHRYLFFSLFLALARDLVLLKGNTDDANETAVS